ncbi:hypothetical protein RF11_12787 [Thelohanellus kitauei]|uniref:Uncharacterized protein n=1 Tax=Thelohanellus kitauei TaxID=669202 RepID=A0A0C2I7Z8_THEKT|nr:hypothetical protein RF11_12787 [Thelohanellus kitauei]
MNYTHFTVNHYIDAVDPVTGAYTRTVDSTWRHIMKSLPDIHTHHGRLHIANPGLLHEKFRSRFQMSVYIYTGYLHSPVKCTHFYGPEAVYLTAFAKVARIANTDSFDFILMEIAEIN